ncbi:hypothetical protein JL_148 [Bacillus phage JL]|uniref:Uncharacterized protein n=1 Tax=Bacillus phage JL TaxID=1296655 RepID=S5MM99_9CAUD|nr:hypothetical protein AVV47_gp148 [Bacillus phage JL]AGR46820.1 hypothetical protein JL_148 [Bacillus phage JL]
MPSRVHPFIKFQGVRHMNNNEIIRTPISVNRSPISVSFCNCYNQKIIKHNDHAYAVCGDKMSLGDLKDYLLLDLPNPIYFTHLVPNWEEKINLVLDNNTPVILKTGKAIPTYLVKKMGEQNRSTLRVVINSLDDSARKLVQEESSEMKDIREMMFIAKAWKVFVSCHVDYFPHIMKPLDLLQLVEMNKNLVSSITVDFPAFTIEFLEAMVDRWQMINPKFMEHIQKYYLLDEHEIYQPRCKAEILSKLDTFVKGRRVNIIDLPDHNITEYHTEEPPFGISYDNQEPTTCGKCGRLLYA